MGSFPAQLMGLIDVNFPQWELFRELTLVFCKRKQKTLFENTLGYQTWSNESSERISLILRLVSACHLHYNLL